MRVTERPFSDLLRHPKDVTVDVEQGDVVLRRRDAPDLRLTRADRDADRAAVFLALGRTLRNLAVHRPDVLDKALGDAFPWLEVLPPDDRATFVEEFTRVAVAAGDLDVYNPLSQLIREWRATAEVHADPDVAKRLYQPTTADGPPVAPPPE